MPVSAPSAPPAKLEVNILEDAAPFIETFIIAADDSIFFTDAWSLINITAGNNKGWSSLIPSF